MEAAKAGRKRRLGKVCPRCDSRLRYTLSNQCVPCTIERANKQNEEIRRALREATGE
jgi:hypothetical protein